MALYARRKLVLSQEQSEQGTDYTSLVSAIQGHCHSLGRTLSRLQHDQHRRTGHQSIHCRRHQRKERLTPATGSPFATITFGALPCALHKRGIHLKPGIMCLTRCQILCKLVHLLQALRRAALSKCRTSCLRQLMKQNQKQRLVLPKLPECHLGV